MNRVNTTARTPQTSARRNPIGEMMSNPPPPAMTPLPPLKPSNGENVWPITANAEAIT